MWGEGTCDAIERSLRNFIRKPLKRFSKTCKLLGQGKYVQVVWYVVGTSIHGAFTWSLFKLFHSRCSLEYIVLVASQLIGKEVNRALKKHFNQRRPSASGKTSNGMPSYHAQHAFFFSSFILQNQITSPEYWPIPISAAALIAYSRVAIQMHSYDQVIVGSCIGMAQSWLSTLVIVGIRNGFLISAPPPPLYVIHVM
mmetsp:Transcript_20451/g.28535  ORF Transcript_20451/g.28535 Transcript_20451/m.28535 type:complete len:197 (-) Transcript_20451:357-947(-)